MARPEGNALEAIVMGMVFGALLFWGMWLDADAAPPPFGTACRFQEQVVRQESPPPEVVPPAVSRKNVEVSSGAAGKPPIREKPTASLDLLPWNSLSRRAGIGLTYTQAPELWAQRLGAGWYLDWAVERRYPEKLPEHWQMIRLGRGCVAPTREAIRWVAKHYPGSVWVIGNEPDNALQDNLYPEEYVQVYHDLYFLIKEADPTAAIAVAGVTQATPLRMAYLDRVLDLYAALYGEPMPVDWWTVHGYVLREDVESWGAGVPTGFPAIRKGKLYEIADVGRVDLFKEHIIAFRTWMAERGYRDNPLAITEFGIVLPQEYGFSPDFVAGYLLETFTWLGEAKDDRIGYPEDSNRLVQRWAWFSLYDPLYPTSNLVHLEADALTEIGWTFRRYVEGRVP